MKKSNHTVAKIFGIIMLVIFAFGAISFYEMMDYVNRCVYVKARNVASIEVGRLYSVGEIFEIERSAKDNAEYRLYISGPNVTYETFENKKLFRITGGSGTVNISLTVMNDDSPEGNEAYIEVPLVNKQ